MISYEILGAPIALKRVRVCGKRFFDSQVKEKEEMRNKIQGIVNRVLSPNETLKVKIWFIMPIPPSWPLKRSVNANSQLHNSRPDIDNLIKFVFDTFNGVLWCDDAKIAHVEATKEYGPEPKTVIQVEEINGIM